MASGRTRRAQQPAEPRAEQSAPDGSHVPLAATRATPPPRGDSSARTLRALQALTDTALSHLSLAALLPEVVERVRAVMRVDNVGILLLDEPTQELEVSAARGPEEDIVGRVRIPVGEGFAGRIAATRAPLAVADLSAYPVSNPLLRDRLRSVLGVPLLAGDRVLGVVHIGMTTPHTFTADDAVLLEQAADRIALAVERARLFEEAQATRLELQRQASLVNLSSEPIFAWSVERGIVEWNAGAEHLYGYTRAEALGRVSHDLLRTVHPMPPQALLATVERDGNWTGELRHTTKDGRVVWVESRQQSLNLGGQRLILETNRDVTERRELEQRTRDALDAFIAITRALVEAPEDNHSRGAQSRDGCAAPDAAQSWRDTNENPLARRLAELTRTVLGCSRVSITALEGEHLLTRPVAVIGLAEDQERQWWEEQETQSGRPLGDGMVPADLDRLLAGEVVTFDLTRPPYEFPNPYGVTAVLAAPMRTQGRIIGLLGLDFEGPRDQPHNFSLEEIQVSEAVARLATVVLERDRLLREREAARADALALADANRRMDEFLSIAGHELRTPVTTIKANLQMAQRRTQQALQASAAAAPGEASGQRDDQGKAHAPLTQLLHLLARAQQAAERQERLVQDLLDISRISSGRLEYRMAPLDLTALVRETVEELRLHDATRHVALDLPSEPVPVVADADRLSQVLLNYLTNAAKYSEGDRPIVVTPRAEGRWAHVAVRDQGPGIAPEQQRRLFERFHRVPGITVLSGSGVGLGLGLFISKTIVEQHGGHVGVESVVGEGSTFWFTLPLAETEPQDTQPSPA